MSTPFRTTRRVEFGDTDMAGIVHFSNFFKYMEAAETAFLRTRGLSVTWLQDGVRYGLPRVSVACDFTAAARFEDELEIEVTVEQVGRRSIRYRFDFRRGAQEIAVGRMTAVYCHHPADQPMASLDIPPDVRAKLEAS